MNAPLLQMPLGAGRLLARPGDRLALQRRHALQQALTAAAG